MVSAVSGFGSAALYVVPGWSSKAQSTASPAQGERAQAQQATGGPFSDFAQAKNQKECHAEMGLTDTYSVM